MQTLAASQETHAASGEPWSEADPALLMQWAEDAPSRQPEQLFSPGWNSPRIGNYELLEEIGRGGMGIIYRARGVYTEGLVALKILQSQCAHRPEFLSRFRREAQAAANLDHPHVLPIYEVNEEADGLPFFTMKLATGGSLVGYRRDLLGKPRACAALMMKVARAAAHAHQRGVLHRDLKPGNILFDARGEPMVGDFGIAAWLHRPSDLTCSQMIFGTPGYLPPEYLEGRPQVLSPASDIYSLGVILFELLAGRLPFEAETVLGALRQAAEKPAPRLRAFAPGADRELEIVCARCLEADPAMRYRGAGELAEDLERWLDGRPILARATPRVVVAWKFARRRPAVSLASALCLTLGVVAFTLNSQLGTATAYDRSIAVLPVEDLDTLSTESELAKEATAFCHFGARGMNGISATQSSYAPNPLPSHGALATLGQQLGSRYVLAATVRRKANGIRLVTRCIDTARGTVLAINMVEEETLDLSKSVWLFGNMGNALKSAHAHPSRHGEMRSGYSSGADDMTRTYLQAAAKHMDRGTKPATDQAIANLQKALALKPSDPETMSQLAGALAYRSYYSDRECWLDEALSFADCSIAQRPLAPSSYRNRSYIRCLRREYMHALEDALEGFELDPDDAAGSNALAYVMNARGMHEQALVWNRRALARDQTPGLYLLYRGDYLTALGAFDDARRTYEQFIEWRGELMDGPKAMAILDLVAGSPERALASIRALHLRFPDDLAVAQDHACIEFYCGDRSVAAELFNKLQAEHACLDSCLSMRGLSVLGYIAGEEDREEAVRLIERALQLDITDLRESPEDGRLLFEKAANLALLGRTGEALVNLARAIRAQPWTLHQTRLDPRLASLRKEEDFLRLINKVKQ